MTNKNTIRADVWRLFYDRLESQVTSVTLADATTQTVQTYTANFPNKGAESSSDYPILVVEDVDVPTDAFTLGKKQIKGQITISIYATKKEALQKFMDAIDTAIITYRGTLKGNQIHELELDSEDYDTGQRGGIQLHVGRQVWSFVYYFNKTW